MNSLFSPIATEPYVGERRAAIMARLPVRTPGEMLFFFPRDYEDFSNFSDVRHLVENEQQTICARIVSVRNRPTRNGSMTTVEIEDGTYGLADLIFFNQTFRVQQFVPGQIWLISGKPKNVKRRWQFVHPVLRLLPEEEIAQINANTVWGNKIGTRTMAPNPTPSQPPTVSVPVAPETIPTAQAFLGLQPVYPLTEGLHAWEMRLLARNIIRKYAPLVEDAFPNDFREKHCLLPIADAIQGIHFPKNQETLDRARRRFIFQELFILQLALNVRRRQQQNNFRAPILEATPEIDRRIRLLFPYELTQGQLKAIADVTRDTTSGRPMNRLIQGDVGCGKTTVAFYAMLLAVAHGFQAAVMAPTEILARQHARNLKKLLAHSPIEIVELIGGLKPVERRQTLEKIASGKAKIIIGTQALLQNDVKFSNLAMVVIDEQHKFGVNQRATLRRSGESPHYLVMTATPIPRSVAMTLFGDLDLTTIRELPPGRQKVKTYFAPKENRDGWWTFFSEKLRAGAQGYVVVPRIGNLDELEQSAEKTKPENLQFVAQESVRPEISTKNTAQASPFSHSISSASRSASMANPNVKIDAKTCAKIDAEATVEIETDVEKDSDVANLQQLYHELSTGPLAEFPLGLLHGKMSQEEKEDVMFKFRTGEIKVLVSTQVIEVGVDVPNATLMTIESAERFGLSQLHQLRGRTARGTRAGYCCVFASNEKEETIERLQLFTNATDGFELSETDFRLRGPGNLFGARQHGLPPLLIADLIRDASILEETRLAAQDILEKDPGLANPGFRRLRQQMLKRYGTALELCDVG